MALKTSIFQFVTKKSPMADVISGNCLWLFHFYTHIFNCTELFLLRLLVL